MSTTTTKTPQDTDLLLPFELQNIPTEYREYYKIRRNNFFASIQGFPQLWEYFMRLDRLWLQEFADLDPASDTLTLFPRTLYIKAHAKIRLAIELAFSGCIAESRSILRDAVEFVAHAHFMLTDPNLQKVWLSKNDGEVESKAFKEAFEHHKRDRVFKGLDELYEKWCQLSETGSHANINAMCESFSTIETSTHVNFTVSYTGLDPDRWAQFIFVMLLTCFVMEDTFFKDYASRLQLDIKLERMRRDFQVYKEKLREWMKARYKIPAPPAPLIHKP
jgi:hypothetical protein